MFTALPPPLDAAALLPPAAGAVVAGVVEDELPELPHADRARARAASPAAPNIFRIRILLITVLMVSMGITYQSADKFTFSSDGLGRRQIELVAETRFTIFSPSRGMLSKWGHAGAGAAPRWPACA